MARRRSPLEKILDALEDTFGLPPRPPARGAFELILWENVAYLVDDVRRRAAFDALRDQVGTAPDDILAAPDDVLLGVTRLGGMHPEKRIDRLRAIAALCVEHAGLDALGELDARAQQKLLKRFPSIGDPGVDKILAFCGLPSGLPLDSNGLRALLRLGYGEEASGYQQSYRSAQAAAAHELPTGDPDALVRAHLLLRAHGQETCRRSAPQCSGCAVRRQCAYFRARPSQR